MGQVGISVQAGPVVAPLLDSLEQGGAVSLVGVIAPLHVIRDNHRGEPDLQ